MLDDALLFPEGDAPLGERGIFNREVATAFRREVLERGNQAEPMELFKRFRGREPDPDALLRRMGLA